MIVSEGGADVDLRGRRGMKGSMPIAMPKVNMEPRRSKSPVTAQGQRGVRSRSRSPGGHHRHISELSRSMSPERYVSYGEDYERHLIESICSSCLWDIII